MAITLVDFLLRPLDVEKAERGKEPTPNVITVEPVNVGGIYKIIMETVVTASVQKGQKKKVLWVQHIAGEVTAPHLVYGRGISLITQNGEVVLDYATGNQIQPNQYRQN